MDAHDRSLCGRRACIRFHLEKLIKNRGLGPGKVRKIAIDCGRIRCVDPCC